MPRGSDVRQDILGCLKRDPGATMGSLAEVLDISTEAVRQHLVVLEKEGWVHRQRKPSDGVGRPPVGFYLTAAGEHLFPKHYDDLAAELVETIALDLGEDAVRRILSALTDKRVQRWMPRLQGKSLRERMEALTDIYLADDPFMTVDADGKSLRLVEQNCPFLNVAHEHPVLCSVTVCSLTRLLGYRVVREQTFQDGDGRCVFRVLLDEPIDPETFTFEFEGERSTRA